MVATIVGASIAGPLVITGGLALAGFGAAEVGAGTLAAGIQSGIGNVVAGSLFAGKNFKIFYEISDTSSFK